jgi:RNA polymerase sigma-70 factor (ECF subfamily)
MVGTPETQHEPMMMDTTSFWRGAYEAHAPAVLAFLGRRLPNREEAEDLLQETFVRAMRAGNAREEHLRYYLLTTARHLLVNRFRRPRLVVSADVLATHRSDEEAPADDRSPLEAVADPALSPERDAAWSAFRVALDRAVSALSPDLARAFQLGVVERHPYADIMRATGWSLPQVKSNVFRARQRVIAKLGDRLEDALWSHGS